MTSTRSDDAAAVLIYDGECPVCSAYVRFVRFRESVGGVELINARDGGNLVDKVVSEKYDLNEGMVLWYGDQFYHGADCIHMLAMLSTDSGFINKVNAAIFRRPGLARALYPVLRLGRNALLWILGKSKIELD